MAHKALKMRCPYCDTYCSRPTCKTYSEHYHWNDEIAEILKKHSSKDIAFRKRKRWCEKCGRHFDTVEMRYMDLKNLIGSLEAYKWMYENALTRIQRIVEENQDLIKKNQDLTEKIHEIEKITTIKKPSAFDLS